MKTFSIEKLNEVSEAFLLALNDFLHEDDNYSYLLKQIGNTGIVIEMDDYQLLIDSQDELKVIKSELKSLNEHEVVE